MVQELHTFKVANAINGSSYLDDNLRMIAFNLARKSNQPSFFKLITSIYELDHRIGKELFLPKIHELINERNYKDVSRTFLVPNKAIILMKMFSFS